MRSSYIPTRSMVVLLVTLSLWQTILPMLTVQAQESQPASSTVQQTLAKDAAGNSRPTAFEAPNEQEDAALVAKAPVGEDPAGALNRENNSVALMLTGLRRLKFNEFDKAQLDALSALAEQFALNPDLAKQYSAGKLPADIAERVGADKLQNIDPRIIRSIINLITPTNLGGAGHELLEISSITKGHTTKDGEEELEGPTPEGESTKKSPHVGGKAADVTAIDYLRGTEYTIEVDKDNKPKVTKTKRLPLEPVSVAWQDPAAVAQAGTRDGVAPRLNGGNPALSGTNGILQGLMAGLAKGIQQSGADVDVQRLLGKLSSFENLAQLAKQAGQAELPQALGSRSTLYSGPNGFRRMGQEALSAATDKQIPAFGFFGETPDELFYNSGREIITRNLGLADGALMGRTSSDVITNAGERFWETKLGDLPLGTLDGIAAGSRDDLERHIGRGVLAKLLDMEVGAIPLGAAPADFQKALGLAWSDIQQNGQLLANQLGVPTVNAVGLIQSNPDELLRQTGRASLATIQAYTANQRDAAFNLEERPSITDLPTGSDRDRATALLGLYEFKNDAKNVLQGIQSGTSPLSSTFKDDTELRAWLLVNAYQKGSNPDRPLLTDRFLAADSTSFYDSGIEVIAKGLSVGGDTRAALRQYLRTGEFGEGAVVDLNYLAQTIGFSTRDDFDAVFRNDAPVVGFSHVGRLAFARFLSTNPEAAAPLMTKPIAPTGEQLTTQLQSVKKALEGLRSDRSIRPQIDAALTATDGLIVSAGDGKIPLDLNLNLEWRQQLAVINKAGQAAANSAKTGIAESRALLVATNGLFAPSGDGAYAASTVKLTLPGGKVANELFGNVLAAKHSVTDAVERIGGWMSDGAYGLTPNSSYQLGKDVAKELARGNVPDAEKTIERFASSATAPLGDAVRSIQLAAKQLSNPLTLDPKTLARSLLAGWRLQTTLGTRVLDAGFQVSWTNPLEKIFASPFGPGAQQQLFDSIGLRQLARAIAGVKDIKFDPEKVGGQFKAMLYTTISARTGWEIGPDGPVLRNPQLFIESVTGKPLTKEAALALGIIDTSPEGLKNFASQWKFWEDPKAAARVEGIVRASFPGQTSEIPAGILPLLFDKNIPAKQRTEQLEGLFNAQVNARLVDPYLASVLNIPGLPAGAVIAAKNILLDKKATPEQKSEALRSLGLATADAVTTSQFGFPVSWMVNKDIDPKEKIRIGLNIAASKLGLDPAITSLVNQAYEIFYVGDGIDTNTPAGRAQLAGLMTAAGSAAGVPPEYTAIAAAFVTGDVEATAIAYAGGHFDQALRAAGISGVGFRDFYEAFAGPTKATLDQMKLDAANQAMSQLAGGDGELQASLTRQLLNQKLQDFQQIKQENLMFASADIAISKATGVSVSGFARAFMKGTVTDQAAAAGQLISAITGSPEAAMILGNRQLVEDFQKFAKSGNLDDISDASFASMDGYIAYATGVPIPPGATKAIVDFGRTGDVGKFETLVNPDTLVAFGGGYVDKALGLPSGATSAMYGAYKNLEAAQKAYDASKLNDLLANQGFGGVSDATKSAAGQLGAAQAGLVSLGVNLVFGETFAKLDNQLGLPSGTVSMLVSTGIYAAMVPGIALGSLFMATILPWAAPLILAELFGLDLGSLFGGLFGAKKQEQKIILWSREPGLWPDQAPYNCYREGEPKPDDRDERPKGQMIKLDPFTCELGKEIVFAKDLPPGVFYGPPPSELEQAQKAGQQQAADANVQRLLWNLLTMSGRTEDEALIPNQIRSHTKQHGLTLQSLMDEIWGDGSVGSYVNSIGDDGANSRRGYLFDEPGKQPFFAQHVHWNY